MVDILIVDDEYPVQKVLIEILKNQPHSCSLASDAAKAREALSERNFDLMLCDIDMPGESGLDLSKFVLANYSETAVIIMTGLDDTHSVKHALEIGAYSYISKPIEKNSLLFAVENALKRNQLEKENRIYGKNLESLVDERTRELAFTKFAFDNAPVAIEWLRSDTAEMVYVNKHACELLGYSQEEMLNLSVFDFDPVYNRDAWPAFRKEMRRQGQMTFNSVWGSKDGSSFPVGISARPLIYEGEEYFIAFIQDITEKVQAEERLRENERQYRELVDNANSIILRLDTQGNIKFRNKYALTFFGFGEGDLLDEPITGTILPAQESSGQDLKTLFQKLVKNPKKFRYNENENVRKNGDRAWIAWTNTVLFDDDGNVSEVLCIGNDITERKRAELALQESDEKFRAISASAQEAIIIMSKGGKISYWNPAAENIFGYSVGEALNENLHELIAPRRYREEIKKGMSIFHGAGYGSAVGKIFEVTAQRKDGTEFPVELSLSAMKLKDQWTALCIIRDISKRKILEGQLLQAQKLESIGQLAAGIAHEINTPTQYVGYNTQFLKEQFEQLVPLLDHYQKLLDAAKAGEVSEDLVAEIETQTQDIDLSFIKDEIPPAVEQTLEGIERVSEIVRAMKEFSHPGSDEKTPIDINRAIESTITVARNEWKYVAEMMLDLDADLPLVPCLPDDFNQVILNMIVNAAHAIGDAVGDRSDKGTISIATARKNGWAEIRVKDTGTGIAPKHQSRIFDPFFTTKDVGKGTGQGLAISHSIIADKHDGQLNFETKIGHGTTFIIRLPINPD